jgi:hypothetical protein
MPPHRIFAPDAEVLGRAALLSGILCRLQGYEKDGKLRALQDCVLFLQAQKLGLVVLTANVGDCDILLQLIPAGRVLFYRSKWTLLMFEKLLTRFRSATLKPLSPVSPKIDA